MTTEMLVKVVTWPAEFEVMAVSLIVLVLAREVVEDAVEEVPMEVLIEMLVEEALENASEVELVSSINNQLQFSH